MAKSSPKPEDETARREQFLVERGWEPLEGGMWKNSVQFSYRGGDAPAPPPGIPGPYCYCSVCRMVELCPHDPSCPCAVRASLRSQQLTVVPVDVTRPLGEAYDLEIQRPQPTEGS
jgi:hypothetical protein